ncbi:Phage antirepressor protein KilAC domain protein [compost metagenome]
MNELEAQAAKPTPAANLNDPAALRGLLLGYTEQVMKLEHQVGIQAEKITEDAPKVKVFTKLVDQKGYINFQKFCTQLNLHQRKIKAWLRDIGWLRDDQWEVNPLPTAKAVDAGYCQIKRFETESGKLKQQIVFTGKAEAYVELKAPEYVRKPVRKERQKVA